MKKLFVISFVSFLFSCSTQKECNNGTFNLSKVDIEPKDSVYIVVERIVNTFNGTYVRNTKGNWYRISYGRVVDFNVGDTTLVFNEWKSLPPCPRNNK